MLWNKVGPTAICPYNPKSTLNTSCNYCSKMAFFVTRAKGPFYFCNMECLLAISLMLIVRVICW